MRDYLPDGEAFGLVGAQTAVAIGLIVGLWWLRNVLTRRVDEHFEMFVMHNWSTVLQLVGQPLMLAIGVLPLIGSGLDYRTMDHDWGSLWWVAGGLLGLAAFGIIGQYSVTRLMLRGAGAQVDPAVRRARKERLFAYHAENPGFRYDRDEDTGDSRIDTVTEAFVYLKPTVSLFVFSFMVSLGIIGQGVLAGDVAPGLEGQAVPATVVFFGLGLGALLLGAVLHDRISRYGLHERIKRGEWVAAVEGAGAVVALAWIIMKATAGDFTGWTDGLIGYGLALALAYGSLYLARGATDVVILTGCTVRTIQENRQVAAAAVMVTFLLVNSLLVGEAASVLVF